MSLRSHPLQAAVALPRASATPTARMSTSKSHSSHPWHDLSLGEDAPNVCNAVIEIPRGARHQQSKQQTFGKASCQAKTGRDRRFDRPPAGSKVKYELDKETGMLYVDRVLYSSVVYPHECALD